ncbi:MAG: VPLPA-CTERM sorting domain-containing protein [Aestuariibacter sp.]|nr:VPLPA-CTERM sorting domain-containing protein [Aestuariibacter sp.]
MYKKIVAIVALTLASQSANAAIVDLGNLTRDTGSGIEWLDLTETRGMSYNEVMAETQTGTLQGWEYATAAQFDQLISNFGYTPVTSGCLYSVIHCDNATAGQPEVVEHIIRTLGDTADAYWDGVGHIYDAAPDGAGYSYGMLAEYYPSPTNTNITSMALIYDYETIYRSSGAPAADDVDYVMTLNDAILRDDPPAQENYGSFLVRPVAPVPLPAAVWLFGSAIAGFGVITRRRKGVDAA